LKSRLAILLVVASALAAVACHHDGDAVLLVVVTASGSPPPVSSLDVTLTGPAGASTANYARANGEAIAFPTTLTAVVPARAVGDIVVDVHAMDAVGTVLAAGHQGPVSVGAGDHDTVFVELQCGDNPCLPGGGPSDQDGGPDASPSCGNGRVDPGETCDTAIAPGVPGACPPSDCKGCLRAVPTGNACTAHCEPITATVAGDGCCPANATNATDPDCSANCGNNKVDPGETCDTGIPAGSPGACPMTAADCASGDPCSIDTLISAGTCSAVCVHAQITMPTPSQSDGCCPPGANHLIDSDCPVVCGDGVRESPESCDLGIPPLANSACPVSCDDGDPCTIDILSDQGTCAARCSSHVPITAPISGDGCCPPGANHATDSDCPPTCGNGVIEPGEVCDGDSGPFACPTSCPAPPSACLRADLYGSRDYCNAQCVTSIVTECSPQTDGCCPQGCDGSNDPDCSPVCGDGALQPTRGELCEISFPSTSKKACPMSCVPMNACHPELLVSAGTCEAQCVVVPVTAIVNGDGCCPDGADSTVDADCAPKCDNHVVEPPGEACDPSVAGSCPTSCPAPPSACTVVEMQGKLGSCDVRCVTQTIVGCLGGDGCCPTGCTALTDSDCPPVCGDGAVETGETCDRAITAGFPGACPRSCDDGDACTVDLTDGAVANCTRACTHVAVTACLGGDGCCPEGCTAASDADCNPVCNDGRVGAGETCDPPSACPTSCPDDGDPCTREQLTGDADHCTAACQHVPITTCSGSTVDACCPTGCTPASDSDC
jgi:hypothetical protein